MTVATPPPTPDHDTRRALITGLATHLGVDESVFDQHEPTVVALADRADTRRCSVYRIGPALTFWCDPDIAPTVQAMLASQAPPTDLSQVDTMFNGSGTHEGRGLVHVVGAGRPNPTAPPSGMRTVVIDPRQPADMELFREFASATPADDLDAAEIDPDQPDPHIELMLDRSGRPVAHASWIPWKMIPGFGHRGGHRAECPSPRGSQCSCLLGCPGCIVCRVPPSL